MTTKENIEKAVDQVLGSKIKKSVKKHRDILDTFNQGFPLLATIFQIYEKSPEVSADPENTLRRSVEMTTLEVLETIVVATRQRRESKITSLEQAITKLDTLKVFIDLAQQTGVLKGARGLSIMTEIGDAAKMINGWIKALK